MVTDAVERDWWELRPGQQPSTAGLGHKQRKLLEYLGQHSDTAFTTAELAKHLSAHHMGVYNGARGLVHRRLVTITTPVGPGRVRHLQITPTGIARLLATTAPHASQAIPSV